MEIAIIFVPLFGAILSGFFGRYIGDRNSEIIASLLVSISAFLSFIINGRLLIVLTILLLRILKELMFLKQTKKVL